MKRVFLFLGLVIIFSPVLASATSLDSVDLTSPWTGGTSNIFMIYGSGLSQALTWDARVCNPTKLSSCLTFFTGVKGSCSGTNLCLLATKIGTNLVKNNTSVLGSSNQLTLKICLAGTSTCVNKSFTYVPVNDGSTQTPSITPAVITFSPTSWPAGSAGTINWSPSSFGSNNVEIWLCNNLPSLYNLSVAATANIAGNCISRLAAGVANNGSYSLTIPAGTKAKSYYFYVRKNGNSANDYAGNNFSSSHVTISSGIVNPDTTSPVTTISPTVTDVLLNLSTWYQGDTNTFNVKYRNFSDGMVTSGGRTTFNGSNTTNVVAYFCDKTGTNCSLVGHVATPPATLFYVGSGSGTYSLSQRFSPTLLSPTSALISYIDPVTHQARYKVCPFTTHAGYTVINPPPLSFEISKNCALSPVFTIKDYNQSDSSTFGQPSGASCTVGECVCVNGVRKKCGKPWQSGAGCSVSSPNYPNGTCSGIGMKDQLFASVNQVGESILSIFQLK